MSAAYIQVLFRLDFFIWKLVWSGSMILTVYHTDGIPERISLKILILKKINKRQKNHTDGILERIIWKY